MQEMTVQQELLNKDGTSKPKSPNFCERSLELLLAVWHASGSAKVNALGYVSLKVLIQVYNRVAEIPVPEHSQATVVRAAIQEVLPAARKHANTSATVLKTNIITSRCWQSSDTPVHAAMGHLAMLFPVFKEHKPLRNPTDVDGLQAPMLMGYKLRW